MIEIFMIAIGIIAIYSVVFLLLCSLAYSISFSLARGWYTGKNEVLTHLAHLKEPL